MWVKTGKIMERYTLAEYEAIFDVKTNKYIVARKITLYKDKIVITKPYLQTQTFNYGELGVCHGYDLEDKFTRTLNSMKDFSEFESDCRENGLSVD